MKAGRIHHFGPPNAIVIDEIPCPTPEEGELVVRVDAAGVGPWDALIQLGASRKKQSESEDGGHAASAIGRMAKQTD